MTKVAIFAHVWGVPRCGFLLSPLKPLEISCITLDLPQNTPAKYMMSSQQINVSAALSIRKRRDIFQPQLLLCTPEEIAGAVAFLSSRDAAYVTGETLVVSGGMQSKL